MSLTCFKVPLTNISHEAKLFLSVIQRMQFNRYMFPGHQRRVLSVQHQDLTLTSSTGILSEFKINNCDIAIREPGATADDLVDVIEGNRSV